MKTYSDLHEQRWDGRTTEEGFCKSLSTVELKAWKAIELFELRAGFDHWWDDVSQESKNELFEELKAVVA